MLLVLKTRSADTDLFFDSIAGQLLLDERLVLLRVEDCAVLLVLVMRPVADVIVGGATSVLARVRPRLDVNVHHVRPQCSLDDEALATFLASMWFLIVRCVNSLLVVPERTLAVELGVAQSAPPSAGVIAIHVDPVLPLAHDGDVAHGARVGVVLGGVLERGVVSLERLVADVARVLLVRVRFVPRNLRVGADERTLFALLELSVGVEQQHVPPLLHVVV